MASHQPRPSPRRVPARRVRELAPFVLLACACGAAVREPGAGSLPSPTATPLASDAGDLASAADVAFEARAARRLSVASGMREVARRESGTDPVDLIIAEGRDACLRVAFESTAPVAVKLLDQGGNVLAATEGPVTEGVLGARGPVCLRKGDVVRGLAEGAGARVRWMAWEAR